MDFKPILGPSWAHLGAILGPLGPVLGPLGPILGPSWGHLGPSWALLGHLGALPGCLGAFLGPLGCLFLLLLVPAMFWISLGGRPSQNMAGMGRPDSLTGPKNGPRGSPGSSRQSKKAPSQPKRVSLLPRPRPRHVLDVSRGAAFPEHGGDGPPGQPKRAPKRPTRVLRQLQAVQVGP